MTRATLVALRDHVAPDVFEGVARQGVQRRELVEDGQRHVELAHGPECSRQPTDLAARLPDLAALDAGRQHRHGLPQAS